LNNTATVEVQVAQQDLVAVIGGGAYRQAGRDNAFTLDGSGSYDPDQDSGTAMTYSWECGRGNGTGACGLDVGVDLSSSTLTVGVEGLAVGTYTFALVVGKGARSSSSVSVQVEVVAGAPPVVAIAALAQKKYNTDANFLSVSATVTSSLDVSTVWSAQSSDVASVFRSKGVPATTVSGSLSALVALFRLTPGATYTLVLTATDSDGSSAFATTTVAINSPPGSGVVAVSPLHGYSLNTGFEFSAVNWVDDDKPLK
jgi:hypothetical protein